MTEVCSELAGAAARGVRGGLTSDTVCPSCHALQRSWEADRARGRFGTFDFSPWLWPGDVVPISPIPNDPGTTPLTPEQAAAIREWLQSAPAGSGQ